MNSLYFLGTEIAKVVGEIKASEMSGLDTIELRLKLVSLQKECPHWKQWRKREKCSFCQKNWAEIERGEIEQPNADVINLKETKALVAEMEKMRIRLLEAQKELRRLCSHPRKSIVHEAAKTYCQACGSIFWSGFSCRNFLSVKDTENVAYTKIRLGKEYDCICDCQGAIQKICPHPPEAKTYGEQDVFCKFCLRDWWEIEKERQQQVAISP